MKPRWWGAATALAVVILGMGMTAAPARAQQDASAKLRLVHAATGLGPIDATIGGQIAAAAMGERTAGDYRSVPAGQQPLRITVAGQPERVLLDTRIDIPAGADATVALVGGTGNLSALVLRDENSPPPSGQAKVRFVHGAPDVPRVDIRTGGGGRVFGGIAYRERSDYVTVPAGTYDLSIQANEQDRTLATIPDVTLQAGQVITFFATGAAATGTLAAIPVSYTAGAASAASAPPLPLRMPNTGAGPASAAHASPISVAAVLFLTLLGAAATRRLQDDRAVRKAGKER